MIQRTKVDVSVERRLLSNIIMSTPLLAACVQAGRPGLFSPGACRTVAQWVWEYFSKTGEAPKEAMTDVYMAHYAELQDADAALIRDFLSALSNEWAPTNVDLSTEMALRFFRIQAATQLSEALADAVKTGDPATAEKTVAEYVKPETHKAESIDMMDSPSAGTISDAFNEEAEILFGFPEVLGKVIGGVSREDFMAFLAPPKRGKTWWLIATAVLAYLQGQQVLFISLEMRKQQVVRRFWQFISGRSRRGEKAPWPRFVDRGNGEYEVEDAEKKTTQVDTSLAAIQKIQHQFGMASRGGALKVRTYPTGSLSIAGLKTELKNLEVYEHFCPTVIVVDYADVMDHGKPVAQERDRINNTWLSLRGLAMDRKCAVVTASQSGRQTVDGTRDAHGSDVAEDIRKLAHVTKMVALNQTQDEAARGIYRLACEAERDGAKCFDQAVCTSCLAIGRPFLEVQLLSHVRMGGEEEWKNGNSSPRQEQETPVANKNRSRK